MDFIEPGDALNPPQHHHFGDLNGIHFFFMTARVSLTIKFFLTSNNLSQITLVDMISIFHMIRIV